MAGSRKAVAFAGGLAALNALPALSAVAPALRAALGVEDRVPDGGFALTFDDGPHPQGTPAALEVLAKQRVKATFFLVGEQVVRYRSLAEEVAAAGHRIGVHCFSHRNLLGRLPVAVWDDLARAEEAIATATGKTPDIYRPPYGVLSLAALTFARRRGWRTYLWTAWGRDWERTASPRSIASLLLAKAGPGGVGLLHDADHYSAPGSHLRTAAALPLIFEGLASLSLRTTVLP